VPLPSRQIIYISQRASDPVDRPRATNSDSAQFNTGLLRALREQRYYALHGMIEAAGHIGRAFILCQKMALYVNHSYRNLGAPDIDRADHVRCLFESG
jgi:hypothetical protein